jgi:4,4'-diaponeurosporenoate glycosyltransferase
LPAVGFEGVVLVLGWLAGWVLLLRVPLLPSAVGNGRRPVSVVVPARDEEETLPRLLASLAAQDPPPDEVIVVDDGSTDATAERARAAGATLLTAGALPPGWTGKAWACWEGARRATGDWLVFLDADVRLAPGALGRLLAAHPGETGPATLVSVAPYHVVRRPHENLSAVFNVVAIMGTGMAAALPTGPQVGAFGPCLLCRRADYLAVGGHEAVRGEILDDLALARRFASVRNYGGRRAVLFRMYPEGLRQLVEGWSKNFAGGAAATPLPRTVLVVAWVTGCLAAAAAGVGVAYLAYAVQFGAMAIQLGSFWALSIVFFPVPLVGFLAIFARSLVLTRLRRRVRWKGREIPLA